MDWCARLGSNQQPLPSEGSRLSAAFKQLAARVLRFLSAPMARTRAALIEGEANGEARPFDEEAFKQRMLRTHS